MDESNKNNESAQVPQPNVEPIQPTAPAKVVVMNPPVATQPQLSQEVPKTSNAFKAGATILAFANLVTIGFPIFAMVQLGNEAKKGVSGTEFIALLLIPIFLVGFIVAVINIIFLVRYLKKYKPRLALKIVSIILIIVSSLYVLLPGGSMAYSGYKTSQLVHQINQKSAEEKKLNDAAAPLQYELEKILGNYQTVLGPTDYDEVLPNTKATTTDPSIDAYARIGFKTSDSLMNTEMKVFTLLQASGFTRDGGDKNPYFISGTSKWSGVSYIVMRYVKGDKAVVVEYSFDKTYGCPAGYTCSHTANDVAGTKLYHVSGYKDLKLKDIQIRYGTSPNNYGTTFSSEYF